MQAHQSNQPMTAQHVGLVLGAAHRHAARRRRVPQGARIFGKAAQSLRPYTVASGEVVIVRDGLLVDLVEAGELLDPRIWQGATAIARTDCTLAPRPTT